MVLSQRYLPSQASYVHLSPEQEAARQRVLSNLASGDYETQDVDCPCGGRDDELIAMRDRYSLPVSTYLCRACGLLRSSPQLTPASTDKFYAQEYRNLYQVAGSSPESLFKQQRRRGQVLMTQFQPLLESVSTVFEVGCGAGGILAALKAVGKDVAGCDFSPDHIGYGRSEGIEIVEGSAQALAEKHGQADLVVLLHVLEHFGDLKSDLEVLQQVMRRDSVLLIEVPGLARISSDYNHDFLGYLQNAHNYHFTAVTLEQALRRGGFQVFAVDDKGFALAMLAEGEESQQPPVDKDHAEVVAEFLRQNELEFQRKHAA